MVFVNVGERRSLKTSSLGSLFNIVWYRCFFYATFLLTGVEEPENEGLNTEVKFQVSALTLVLSKKRYPIAKVKAFGLFTDINMRDGNLAAAGRLTSVSVTDMSPHGTMYREK